MCPSRICLAILCSWIITVTVLFVSRSARKQPLLFTIDLFGRQTQRQTFNDSPTDDPLHILSKSLVIRRVYLDNRKRHDHKNTVVFMLDIKRSLTSNMFTGCRVGQVKSSMVKFRHSKSYTWTISHRNITENVAFVDCFDVDGISDGDPAFLEIKIRSETLEVKSQRNVIVPHSRKDLSASHPSVVSCVATLRLAEIPPSEDGMLYQWLRYQKTIGVDHVHIIAEDTFVTKGGFDHPIITDALKENYLSIDFWPRWFNTTEIWHSSQHLGSTDCVYKFQGIYDYIIISDSDEFFVPRGKSKSIKTYLKSWCSGKRASCNFQWHEMYPDCGWSPESVGPDGNLTTTVHRKKMDKRNNVKSVHQIHALIEVGRHTAMSSLPGYQNRNLVPFKQAYFAHLRKGRIPSGGC